ncbi:MAG: VanW family protein, partial [Oscillospiraceae bacterium]|nr:VanW family protein [Oscillospiraceae bacterium]
MDEERTQTPPENGGAKYDLTAAYAEYDSGCKELPEESVETPTGAEYGDYPRRGGAGRLAALIAVAAVVLLAAGYVILCAVAANRSAVVSQGTSIMGVDVSGLTRQEVVDLWKKEGPKICDKKQFALMLGGKELTRLSYTDLAATLSPEDAADKAMRVGRNSSFLRGGLDLLRGGSVTGETQIGLNVDEKAMDRAVDELCDRLGGTAVDGDYRLDEEQGLFVTKPRDGLSIDRASLRADIGRAVATGDASPISCKYVSAAAQPVDLSAIHEELYGEMRNAGIDVRTGELYEATVGVDFDVEEAEQILAAAEPGQEVLIPSTVTYPTVYKEDLEGVLFRDLLGEYSTVASGSENRQKNVRKAAMSVNGKILNSGEVFSYNAVVGDPSEANGYFPAPAYVGGKTVDVFGGGVCQVASTTYYASLLSNLQIVDRSAHQYAPSYITFGCDATTFYPYTDFKFRNNTDYPIRVEATYTNNNTVTIRIYGTKTNNNYVKMVSKTLSTTPFTEQTVVDKSLKPGQRVLDQSGYTGYEVKTWRQVYSGDGRLISETFEATSIYEMRPAIYHVGPTPEPEP